MRLGIIQLTDHEKSMIRRVVRYAMDTWPNAHLGDTPRWEDMREAFRTLRRYIMGGASVEGAVGMMECVECDIAAFEDM